MKPFFTSVHLRGTLSRRGSHTCVGRPGDPEALSLVTLQQCAQHTNVAVVAAVRNHSGTDAMSTSGVHEPLLPPDAVPNSNSEQLVDCNGVKGKLSIGPDGSISFTAFEVRYEMGFFCVVAARA